MLPFILVPLLAQLATMLAQPIPAIIDTDIGSFMDDTFALSLALKMPDLDIRLVVTASHDTTGRARVAAKHLTLEGANHIPIGIGVATSNETGPLFRWAADFDLDSYQGGIHHDGVEAMRQTIDSCHGTRVALIEIGPHTNVKALLERYPHVRHSTRVFIMGGSVVPGLHLPWGSVSPVNTTNERFDPIAARAMLSARWADIPVFAPLATTIHTKINGMLWQKLRRDTSRTVQVLLECYLYWWNESRRDPSWLTHGEAMHLDPNLESPILFDAEAVHLAVTSRWLSLTQLNIDFSDYGRTIVFKTNSTSGTRALFALNWTNERSHGHAVSGLDCFLENITSVLLSSNRNFLNTSHMPCRSTRQALQLV